MEHWYVLETAKNREQESAELFMRVISTAYWSECRILRKIKVFRSGGALRFLNDILFPGYLLVKTGCPARLAAELKKSRELPQMKGAGNLYEGRYSGAGACSLASEAVSEAAPGSGSGWSRDEDYAFLEEADLKFLQSVCGENLQHVMGVTRITLGENNRIIRAEGVLSPYLDRIVKLNLHKRFAVVEVPLFNRVQPVLFGLRLPQDRAV